MFSPGTDLCPLRAFQLSTKTGGGPPSLCNSKEQKLVIQNPRLQVPPAQGKKKGKTHWKLLSTLASHNWNPAQILSRVANPQKTIYHTFPSSLTTSPKHKLSSVQWTFRTLSLWKSLCLSTAQTWIYFQVVSTRSNCKLFPSFVLSTVTA